jgi:hypothetical protein
MRHQKLGGFMRNGNARQRASRNGSFLCALTGLALAAGVAEAATVSITANFAPMASTTALTSSTTNGAQMSGMKVTAGFANGTSETATWGTVDPSTGAAIGTGFYLGATGDTFNATWLLFNLSTTSLLTSLSIDAGAGNTVFDRTNPAPGTNGSANGRDFTDVSGASISGSIVVTYSKAVALTGFTPLGDLFALMSLDLTGLTSGGLSSSVRNGYWFQQDTDNLSLAGDLIPTDPIATPIPGAVFLMGSVLAAGVGFGAWRRKRKHAD